MVEEFVARRLLSMRSNFDPNSKPPPPLLVALVPRVIVEGDLLGVRDVKYRAGGRECENAFTRSGNRLSNLETNFAGITDEF